MRPELSIIIPTLNAERTLENCLKAIRSQTIDQHKIEIWIVDAGSSDNTLSLAKKYECKVTSNPQKQPEYAKYLGLNKAVGQYVMYIDSDQILKNKHSLSKRLNILKKNSQYKHIIGSGLTTPKDAPSINHYINAAGDPFSYYMYHLSSDDHTTNLFCDYPVLYDDKDFFVIKLGH